MLALMVTYFVALFSVVNPFGAVPVFLSLTPDDTVQERNKSALNSSIYFTIILVVFFLSGSYILSFFGISLDAMRIAGGLVILNSGFALLSGKFTQNRIGKKVRAEAIEKEDISFTPMAMPMLSGPGSISLLIGMYAENPEWNIRFMILGVILLTGIVVYGILRISPKINKVLGQSGLKAIARIMGFMVMAIGVQYIITGIVSLVVAQEITH